MDYNTTDNYVSYQRMVSDVNISLSQIHAICEELKLDERTRTLKGVSEKMKNRKFSVGIMGEFKRGKSTVINALLGQEIVPADIVPCTATLNYVRWNIEPQAKVRFKDGREKDVPVQELSSYVTKLTKEYEKVSDTVDKVVVYYPCSFCENGVEIVDTPGLNDDDRMTEIAENVIPNLDAIIMVLVHDAPFSMSEASFVRTKIMTSDLSRLIFVVNKMDTVRKKSDRQRILNEIRKKIQETVLDNCASIYGKDSREYQSAFEKIGSIRVYGISALDALEGKMNHDSDMLEKSGMPEFEAELSRILTEERGLLQLVPPINAALSAVSEAEQVIRTRLQTLSMGAEEYSLLKKEAIEEIREAREKKQKEVREIKNRAGNLYSELLEEIDPIYDEVKSQIVKYIEDYPLTGESVKNDDAVNAAAEAVGNGIDEIMRTALADGTERVLVHIQNKVGSEMDELNAFSREMLNDIRGIYSKMKGKSNDAVFDWGAVAFDTVTSFGGILGVGGIITGWKENGIPGALVGGGSGFVLGIAAMLVAVSFGVAGLPLALVGSIVSAFGGKKVTKIVFNKQQTEKKIENLRSELKTAAMELMSEFRKSRQLENWLRDTARQTYDTVAERLDEELEPALNSMEETLRQIEIDLKTNEGNQKNLEAKLQQLNGKMKETLNILLPLKQKLMVALNISSEPASCENEILSES